MLPSRFIFDDFFKEDDSMKCDIYESDNKYNIELELPGYDKKDITMELDNNYLTISANKSEEDSSDKNYIRRERVCTSSVTRKFYVGNINENDITAEFKNGMLLVSVPKETNDNTKKTIQIN